MSTHSKKITLEKARTFIDKKVRYFNQELTLKNVREIDNNGKPMLLAYFKENDIMVVNFSLLRDEDGKYIDEKLQLLSEDEESE